MISRIYSISNRPLLGGHLFRNSFETPNFMNYAEYDDWDIQESPSDECDEAKACECSYYTEYDDWDMHDSPDDELPEDAEDATTPQTVRAEFSSDPLTLSEWMHSVRRDVETDRRDFANEWDKRPNEFPLLLKFMEVRLPLYANLWTLNCVPKWEFVQNCVSFYDPEPGETQRWTSETYTYQNTACTPRTRTPRYVLRFEGTTSVRDWLDLLVLKYGWPGFWNNPCGPHIADAPIALPQQFWNMQRCYKERNVIVLLQ